MKEYNRAHPHATAAPDVEVNVWKSPCEEELVPLTEPSRKRRSKFERSAPGMIQDPAATNRVARPRFLERDTESPVAAEESCEHFQAERHSVFGWSRPARFPLILALR
jgi:hypothetical protein